MPLPRVYGVKDHYEHCPFPVPGGGDCWKTPHPASRHGLCVEHWREVVEDWVSDAPRAERMCPRCGATNYFDPIYWAAARCGRCGEEMNDPGVIWEAAMLLEDKRRERFNKHHHPGIVYYVQFVDLVKIGFSQNLNGRMLAIPHDTILATEPGDFKLERQRHKQFAEHLVDGQREWFRAAPELLAHAAAVRAEHGDPESMTEKPAVRPKASYLPGERLPW